MPSLPTEGQHFSFEASEIWNENSAIVLVEVFMGHVLSLLDKHQGA
jgi:hypothetical protein